MKRYTTNYTDTFIEVAEDCPAKTAQVPPLKEPGTAARIEYEMLAGGSYRYTSDDVLYASNGNRRGIGREEFFSKSRPCFRASALTKRCGWGVHSDKDGKVAIYAVESEAYRCFASEKNLRHVRAMKSGRK